MNKWNILPDMQVARKFHSSCTIEGLLYVFLGIDEEGQVIRSIEKLQYNYAGGAEYLNNKWKVVELANNEFYYFSTI